MTKIAWLVKSDGTVKEVVPANGKTFSTEEMREFVGGSLELISLPNGKELWVNEEGKLENLPTNYALTNFWKFLFAGYDIGADDYIVGDCLYCDHDFVE